MVISMSKHKYIDKICIVATVLSLVAAIGFLCKSLFGFGNYIKEIGYESRLFDTSKVHTIDIVMDDWESFIDNCQSEEYEICEITIDGETYNNVGIRGKGNTSLSNVSSMGSSRYSFKVEFDQYDDTKSYYGLDKLSLNNIIQDTTYMKDYLTYQMMNEFGVSAPLCSFVYITVNGEDWGLYLAVEGVEESFLQRNYGNNYGELYKPDSMNFGGGRGNGKNFDAQNMGGGMSMGTSDVKLKYIDDDPASYSNIFSSAKTDISDADQKRLIQSLKILSSGEEIKSVVDVDKVLRYFVVHNFVCNGDSYTGSMIHNYYLYEENGKLSMIPWDYNLAYGTFMGGNVTEEVNSPIDSLVSGGAIGDRPMVDWIFGNEQYTELYHQYFENFLSSVDYTEIIENAKSLIKDYVEKDPTKFYTYEEFLQGVETLKEFCALRAESVSGQLLGDIPSTSEGQKEENVMLVDASQIDVSDMGTMNSNKGMGNRGQGNRNKMPEDVSEIPETSEIPDMSEMSEEFTQNMNGFGGEFPSGDFSQMKEMVGRQDFPGSMSTEMGTDGRNGDLVLVGVSVLFLIIGLIVAFKFKGKNF